jgi:hypothetical protein
MMPNYTNGQQSDIQMDGDSPKESLQDVVCKAGMNLRDYFAAKAMCGLLSYYGGSVREKDRAQIDADGARRAYNIADAMMEARKLCN